MLTIIGPGYPEPENVTLINTTSRSNNWSQGLSPFFAGPVDLYDGHTSFNVENAWQYSKVYEYYLEEDGSVGERYLNWAKGGWKTIRGVRYPMGKGVEPLFSYWDGQQMDYIEARKRIYIPLYSAAVQKTSAFAKLKKMHDAGEDLCLWDFDGTITKPLASHMIK